MNCEFHQKKGEIDRVYGVFGGCYSDWYIVGYFNNREDADKYCCIYGDGDYYVEPLKDLTNEKDLSQVSLKYNFEVGFDFEDGKWIMREEPNRHTCYIDEDLHCNNVRKSNSKFIKYIYFNINLDHDDRKLAEKIAQDYLAELRSYGDGEIYNNNIELMNEKFATPFKERERTRKEEELKQKELSELARLKEKYEA